jgi:hypothetical protein
LKTAAADLVNSMSDLFHPHVPVEFIKRVFEIMNECPQQTFSGAHQAAGDRCGGRTVAGMDAQHLDGHERGRHVRDTPHS